MTGFCVVAAVVVAVLAFLISRKPSEFRVQRSIDIDAKGSTVFAHVNDLHKWDAWSPWAKLDPNSKSEFEGPETGVGAKMSWSGNSKVGQGSMTITDSRPAELVRFRLDFLKPMKNTNTAEFTFKQQGNKTTVTWNMFGPNKLMGKIISLFMDCEKMCGDQFDQGLRSLKAVAEADRS